MDRTNGSEREEDRGPYELIRAYLPSRAIREAKENRVESGVAERT